MLYVLWPYPDGARGLATLKANLASEVDVISRLADDHAWAIIRTLADGAYEAVFILLGLDEFIRWAVDPTRLSPLNETKRRFLLGNWIFLEAAA